MKKAISMFLALAMCLSLIACSNGSGDNGENNASNSDSAQQQNASEAEQVEVPDGNSSDLAKSSVSEEPVVDGDSSENSASDASGNTQQQNTQVTSSSEAEQPTAFAGSSSELETSSMPEETAESETDLYAIAVRDMLDSEYIPDQSLMPTETVWATEVERQHYKTLLEALDITTVNSFLVLETPSDETKAMELTGEQAATILDLLKSVQLTVGDPATNPSGSGSVALYLITPDDQFTVRWSGSWLVIAQKGQDTAWIFDGEACDSPFYAIREIVADVMGDTLPSAAGSDERIILGVEQENLRYTRSAGVETPEQLALLLSYIDSLSDELIEANPATDGTVYTVGVANGPWLEKYTFTAQEYEGSYLARGPGDGELWRKADPAAYQLLESLFGPPDEIGDGIYSEYERSNFHDYLHETLSPDDYSWFDAVTTDVEPYIVAVEGHDAQVDAVIDSYDGEKIPLQRSYTPYSLSYLWAIADEIQNLDIVNDVPHIISGINAYQGKVSVQLMQELPELEEYVKKFPEGIVELYVSIGNNPTT